jgi:serine/threonine-protein kinase
MGEVYLASDLSLARKVAIKVLHAEIISDPLKVSRFKLEAFAASSLNHPNILTIHEIGQENENHFIVTEFIDGESLGQRLLREELTLHESLFICIQICSALAAAHAAGITHRDIKPDNIMLRRDRLVKVLDFGLAKLSEPELADSELRTKVLEVTLPGIVMGTAHYMSPEQARGLSIDARTDIFSLGVVLFRMVSGSLPFVGKTMPDVIAAILRNEPPLLAAYRPDVPVELDRIVTKALCKDIDERYQTVSSLLLDLETLKQRLEFETELERLNSKEGISGSRLTSEATTLIQTAQVTRPGINTEGHRLRTTSNGDSWVARMKRHKLGASLILATILLVTTAIGYFAYARYFAGNGRSTIASLAVLPFTNNGNDPDKEYLSDGISESLITRLSQLPGVKVIANSSSSRFKAKDADPQEVGKALGVTAVLLGKILQRGDTLLISVELIDARDRTLLWGQQYTRKASDLLVVQGDISREIAEMLRVPLTAGQQQKLVTSETTKAEAYELILKGRFHSARGTLEDRKLAGDYFNQAIAVDPNYALAYAELSDIYRSLVNSGALDPKVYLPKALSAAQKSLELDDGLAVGHYSLANLKTNAWQWADAESEYKRAIELDPNLALAHRWYASYLRLVGRNEQAIDEIKRARELDPLSSGVNATVGYLLFGARQYDQATDVLRKTIESTRTYPYPHLFLGFTYAAKKMHAEAIASYQEATGPDMSTQIHLAVSYAQAGKREQAQAILDHLQTSTDHVSPAELAMLYTAMGEQEEAFALLERAYEAHDIQLQYLGVAPEFDPLRADPRFQDLMRRVGLKS